jgi:Leucine Rich repeat
MNSDSTKRPWWRHIRLSVRGLIVLVLILGGWLGWTVRSARVQREAVETIGRAGGFITYDWELFRGLIDPNAKPPAPDWLVKLLGVDYFGRVVRVEFIPGHLWHDPEIILSDDTLASLGALTHLESLALSHTSMDDAGLGHLERLRHLKTLSLMKTHVTDAGLLHLKGMSGLRWLSLWYTSVTEAGIRDLRKSLPTLEDVSLGPNGMRR